MFWLNIDIYISLIVLSFQIKEHKLLSPRMPISSKPGPEQILNKIEGVQVKYVIKLCLVKEAIQKTDKLWKFSIGGWTP